MMSEKVQKAINEQIHAELSASYTYLAMSAYCDRASFTGAASWLRLQSQEEYGHAMRLFDFMLARHAKVALKDLGIPKGEYDSLKDVFETAYAQEQSVSGQIESLYELAFTRRSTTPPCSSSGSSPSRSRRRRPAARSSPSFAW
jgi:ferritin